MASNHSTDPTSTDPPFGGQPQHPPHGYANQQAYSFSNPVYATNQAYYQPPAHPTVFVANSCHGVNCTHCQIPMQERTNVCALICLIILVISWFPIGLFCLFMLDNIRYKKCVNCGHTTGLKKATPIYIMFGIFTALEVAAGVTVAVLYYKIFNDVTQLCTCHVDITGQCCVGYSGACCNVSPTNHCYSCD